MRVRASSLNQDDLAYLYGKPLLTKVATGFRGPKHRGLGLDVAGQVEAIGRGVTAFRPGDEVFGDQTDFGHGAFAEFAAPAERAWAHKSPGLSFEEGVAEECGLQRPVIPARVLRRLKTCCMPRQSSAPRRPRNSGALQRRLTETRGRRDQRQLALSPAAQPVDKPWTRDLAAPQLGDVDLDLEQRACVVRGFHVGSPVWPQRSELISRWVAR